MTFFGFSLAMFFAPLASLAMYGLQGAQLLRAAEGVRAAAHRRRRLRHRAARVVMFRRTPYHALDLSDQFSGRRFAELDLMTQLTDRLQASGFTPAMASSQVGRFLRHEAALLALNDAFLLAPHVCRSRAFVWLARATHLPRLTIAQELKQLEAEELMEQI